MTPRISRLVLLFAAGFLASIANAASISLSPSSTNVVVADFNTPRTTTFELSFDFTGLGTVIVDPNVGPEANKIVAGGLILDLTGPINIEGFTPSAFFNTLNTSAGDSDFTGFGTSNKPTDAEYEIHFGSFDGLDGTQVLGTLTFGLSNFGTGGITIGPSPEALYGPFVDLKANAVNLAFNGASIQVAAVPLPPTLWLLATGLGFVGARAARRRRVA